MSVSIREDMSLQYVELNVLRSIHMCESEGRNRPFRTTNINHIPRLVSHTYDILFEADLQYNISTRTDCDYKTCYECYLASQRITEKVELIFNQCSLLINKEKSKKQMCRFEIFFYEEQLERIYDCFMECEFVSRRILDELDHRARTRTKKSKAAVVSVEEDNKDQDNKDQDEHVCVICCAQDTRELTHGVFCRNSECYSMEDVCRDCTEHLGGNCPFCRSELWNLGINHK